MAKNPKRDFDPKLVVDVTYDECLKLKSRPTFLFSNFISDLLYIHQIFSPLDFKQYFELLSSHLSDKKSHIHRFF